MLHDYDAESERLKNSETAQLRAVLIAWDLIDQAFAYGNGILNPLRQPMEGSNDLPKNENQDQA